MSGCKRIWHLLSSDAVASEPKNSPTRRELFLRACRCEPVPRLPVWIMRQAGRYLPEYRAVRKKHSFLEVCKTSELAIEVSLQPVRILDVDAVIVFSDILIPAEALGLQLALTDAGPVIGNPIRNSEDVRRLRLFDPESDTRSILDAIRGLCKSVGPDVPVLGFAGAPWTLACYLVEGQTKAGFENLKRLRYSQPALLREMLQFLARATARYLRAQIAAGAAAVQLFDTWAGELSAPDYEEFALPATRALIEELSPGPVPVILYSKASAHLHALLARTGASVLSVDWRADMRALRTTTAPHLAVQGNVDPCALLGTEEEVRVAVDAAVSQTEGLGHILNLGHGVLPSVPVENAKAFVRHGKSVPLKPRRAEPAAADSAGSEKAGSHVHG
jgi:uroporphyrinogen decarboxylase